MEHRQLGSSGFKVPVLSLGTGTFGGILPGDQVVIQWFEHREPQHNDIVAA